MKAIKNRKEKMRRTKIWQYKENGAEDRYAKGIHFDIRTKGCCYVKQTHAGQDTW